jgi:hypothetical protein
LVDSDYTEIAGLLDQMRSGKDINQFDLVSYIRNHINTNVSVEDVELYMDKRIRKNTSDSYNKVDLLQCFTN